MDFLRLHPTYQRYLIDRRLTPSQAYEMSRLPEDGQHVLMRRIEEAEADTYNKLCGLVNNLHMPPPSQESLCLEMSVDEADVSRRYDRLIERLAGYVRSSFNPWDLKILPRVVTSSPDANIKQLDLIAAELLKIKQALIQAQAAREAGGKEAA